MTEKIPYVAFGNDELKSQPLVREGDQIICPHCTDKHALVCSKNENGKRTNVLMFYRCQEKLYLGAVNGKLVFGLLK